MISLISLIKHPGGEFFIECMKNRDITTLLNIFHPNPEKALKCLKKYALGRPARPKDMHPKYAAPPFLFRKGFDGWHATPKHNFHQGQLLDRIKSRLNQSQMKAKIAQWILYLTLSVLLYYNLITLFGL